MPKVRQAHMSPVNLNAIIFWGPATGAKPLSEFFGSNLALANSGALDSWELAVRFIYDSMPEVCIIFWNSIFDFQISYQSDLAWRLLEAAPAAD